MFSSKQELELALTQLGDVASYRFPNLNYGGCCVFAANVAERLARRSVSKVSVIVPRVHISLEAARNNILRSNRTTSNMNNWQEEGIWFSHVGVRFFAYDNWYTYDSKRLRQDEHMFSTLPVYVACDGSLTIDEAKNLASTSSGWNPRFDRSDIPAIKRLIRSYLG